MLFHFSCKTFNMVCCEYVLLTNRKTAHKRHITSENSFKKKKTVKAENNSPDQAYKELVIQLKAAVVSLYTDSCRCRHFSLTHCKRRCSLPSGLQTTPAVETIQTLGDSQPGFGLHQSRTQCGLAAEQDLLFQRTDIEQGKSS